MLASSILGPGTIFLMIVGAVSISFSVSTSVALLTVTFPVAIFCLTCFISEPNQQVTVLLFYQLEIKEIINLVIYS